MSEIKKFEDADLENLKKLQDRFNNIILQLGQMDIELIKNKSEKDRLEDLKAKLEADYSVLKEDEKQLADQLTKKYGGGILDPRTGDFTPQDNLNKSN